jgi:hypothetical protein
MRVLHDKAFDKSWLSIIDNYRLLLCNTLKDLSNVVSVQRGFIVYGGNPIILPDRFLPDKEVIRFYLLRARNKRISRAGAICGRD